MSSGVRKAKRSGTTHRRWGAHPQAAKTGLHGMRTKASYAPYDYEQEHAH